MTDPLDTGRKAAKQAAKAAETLADALKDASKAAANLDDKAASALAAADEATRALGRLNNLLPALNDLTGPLSALTLDARAAAEHSKARLLGALDDALRETGHKLTGRPPELVCGPLTIELAGTEVRIHYGPGIALLDKVSLDPDKVARRTVELLAQLDGDPLDDTRYLEDLRGAWRAAVAREGGASGSKAPIVKVLSEMAFARQGDGFRRDPRRGAFSDYGRVQFSHDLGRLRTRTVDGSELALTVATRDQTKKASDHLWVAGTHYAYLSFLGR